MHLSFISLVRFVPRHFILFDVVVSGIVFVNYLSDISLLMYRNAVDLCVLIYYFENLLCLFILLVHLMESLGFSIYLQRVTVLLLFS